MCYTLYTCVYMTPHTVYLLVCCTDVSGSVTETTVGVPSPSPSLSPSSASSSAGMVDWSFAQKELLQKAGYDIRKEFEEKEREFEEKEKQFATR